MEEKLPEREVEVIKGKHLVWEHSVRVCLIISRGPHQGQIVGGPVAEEDQKAEYTRVVQGGYGHRGGPNRSADRVWQPSLTQRKGTGS